MKCATGIAAIATSACLISGGCTMVSSSGKCEGKDSSGVVSEANGLWHFDEGRGNEARDSSPFMNDCVLMNMDQQTCWVPGKLGPTALHFDGVDDSVNCGKTTSLNLSDAVTVEMWLKFDKFAEFLDLLSNNLYRIFFRGGSMGNHLYFLFHINEAESPCDSAWDAWTGVWTESEIQEGQWYHVVGVKSENNIQIYLNGAKQKEMDCLSSWTVNTTDIRALFIGTGRFDGTIDEVAIYPRAMTDLEIRARYRLASR